MDDDLLSRLTSRPGKKEQDHDTDGLIDTYQKMQSQVAPTPSYASFLTGKQKAAILLKTMDKDAAVKILSRLPTNEMKELMEEMTRIDHLVPQNFREIIDESLFRIKLMAAPQDQVSVELEDGTMETDPMELLQKANPKMISQFLQKEHPQTTAFALCSLPEDKAALLLSTLPPDMRSEVTIRIATMEPPSPKMIEHFKAFSKYLASQMNLLPTAKMGGIDTLVAILKRAGMDAQRKIFSDLEKINPELLEKVKSLIFTFFDFAHLEPRTMERVLHEVDNLDLAMAIRGAPPAVIENVERSMSERRRLALQKEMEYMGDVTTDMVEKAQKKMLDTYFRLEESSE